MIIDKRTNAKMYDTVHPRVKIAFQYLQENDLSALEPGRYEIDGDNVFFSILEYETKGMEECRYEAHERYADIQYLISGSEKMGYTNIANTKVVEGNKENDLYFLETNQGQGDIFLVEEGAFALFAPQDAHMPGVSVDQPQKVKKAVVKILWD